MDAPDVAQEFQGPQFQKYVDYLSPIARAMARRRSRDHACLSREDQAAYALEVALRVWRHYQSSRPGATPESLYPIAVRAMDRRMRQHVHSTLKFGEAEATIISMETPTTRRTSASKSTIGRERTVGDTIPARVERPVVRVPTLWAVRRVEWLRAPRDDERAVLRELTSPSAATLEAVEELWCGEQQKKNRWNWPTTRIRAVAAGLGWSVDDARAAYRRMRAAVAVEPCGPLGDGGYEDLRVEIVEYQRQRGGMIMAMGTDGQAPAEPAASGQAAESVAGAPAAEKKRPGAMKAVTSPGMVCTVSEVPREKWTAREPRARAAARGGKSDKKKSKEKKAPKAKAEKPRGPRLSTKAAVVYVGGSRAKELRAGTKGVVKRVWPDCAYYGVEFGEGAKKRYHVLASRFVRAAD